ncbi:MAG: penicillin-binding protein activator LpoB [Cytophagaceae bacterium]
MKTLLKLSSFALFGMLVLSCAQKTVTRVSPDQQIDLSGRWNDVDSRLVAEEMTRDMINRPWRNRFIDRTGKTPVIIVGIIQNRSHEHIEATTFIRNIERELINTGTVRVVQNDVFRDKMREERADQQQFATLDTQKRWGRELGADYMLFGDINSIVDQEGKRKVTFYQVNMELSDLETNEKVWLGEKQLKKYIRN